MEASNINVTGGRQLLPVSRMQIRVKNLKINNSYICKNGEIVDSGIEKFILLITGNLVCNKEHLKVTAE